MEYKLNDSVRKIIDRLNAHGKRADIVGGCVRDFILGKEPYDFDITTDATPEEMLEIFSDMKTLDIGIKHGTITVILDGAPYEITTYRTEGDYADHRHPDTVSFSANLLDDLSRRDFTMNAICYNERDGLTDAYSGIADIRAGVIRAVGNPYERFDEDALRIMRALRFSATLGFKIEEKTASALREKAHLLSFVSMPRILAEWRRLVAGDYAYSLISEYSDIIGKIIGIDEGLRLINEEKFTSLSPNLRVLSIFAASVAGPLSHFEKYADALGIERAVKKEGLAILSHPLVTCPTGVELRLSFYKIGVEYTRGALLLYSSLGAFENPYSPSDLDALAALPHKLSDLSVGGQQMRENGLSGAEIGVWLDRLLCDVICGRVENKKEALLHYLNQNR